MPRVNTSQIDESSQFSPLPDGEYLARVRDVRKDMSRKGEEYWHMTCEVIAGPIGAPDPASKGRLFWDNMSWARGGLAACKIRLRAFGHDVDLDEEVDWQPEMVRGRVAVATLTTTSEFDGKPRNKVPYDGWKQPPEQMKGAIPPAPGPAPGSGNAGNIDDDIPF